MKRILNPSSSLRVVLPVTLVLLFVASTASPAWAATRRYQTTIKYTILEQFNVTATEVLTQLNYTDNGRTIQHPEPVPGFCYFSAFPGWVVKKCQGYYYPATTNVTKGILGDFDNVFGPSYEQNAWLQANVGYYRYGCELIRGSLPPGWEPKCAPSRVLLADIPDQT